MIVNPQVGEWVVALEDHMCWDFSTLTKGNLYLIVGVSRHGYDSGSLDCSVNVDVKLFGNHWFRRATAEEVSAKLTEVYIRIKDREDAWQLWLGEEEKASEPLMWTTDTISTPF